VFHRSVSLRSTHRAFAAIRFWCVYGQQSALGRRGGLRSLSSSTVSGFLLYHQRLFAGQNSLAALQPIWLGEAKELGFYWFREYARF
jgi:hypothetical protein